MTEELDECNLFVKYLPADVSDEQLCQLFQPFGEIVSAKVMVDHVDGHSLGYGFVRYALPEQATKAIQNMSGFKIENKKLLCKLSNVHTGFYSHNTEPSTNLYVKPLLLETTDDDLRRVFSEYGEIVECKVMMDRHTQMSRQIGFVRFAAQDSATRALEEMNGKSLEGKGPPIIVRYAESLTQKAARRARKAARMGSPGMQRRSPSHVRPGMQPGMRENAPAPPHFFSDNYPPMFDPYAASPPTAYNPGLYTGGVGMVPSSPPVMYASPSSPYQHPYFLPGGIISSPEDYAMPLGASPPMPTPVFQASPPQPFHGSPPQFPVSPPFGHVRRSHMHPVPSPPSEARHHGEDNGNGSAPINIGGRSAAAGQHKPGFGSPPVSVPVMASPPQMAPVMYGAPIPHAPMPMQSSGMQFVVPQGYGPPPMHYFEQGVPQQRENTNLFVFHLPSDADDNVLLALFEPFGAVESVKVICDKVTKKSKGYGFVKFVHPEDAEKAVHAMNGFPLEKKHLKVSFKTPYAGAGYGGSGGHASPRGSHASPRGVHSPRLDLRNSSEADAEEVVDSRSG